MPEVLAKRLELLEAPPPEFWEDDLELGLDYVLVNLRRDRFTKRWVKKCTGRQVKVLCSCLDAGLSGSVIWEEKRSALHVRKIGYSMKRARLQAA